jgi:hypothetical protein
MIAETRKAPPVYLLIPTKGTDSYGDPVDDWANPTLLKLPGASLQAHATEDKDVNTGTTTVRTGTLQVHGSTGVVTQVTDSSRVKQGDVVWRVNGTPNIKIALMYGNTHLTASLTRTTTEAPSG